MRRSAASDDATRYPCSDGRPMAESDAHIACVIYVLVALKQHFEARALDDPSMKDVYVAGNMFLYHKRGDPGAVVAPDVFVVLGAPSRPRDSYLLWNEPKGPDFVLEVTSKGTRKADQEDKRDLYASLGVREYFLYDPRGEYLTPPLRGYRLHGGGYRALPAVSVFPGGVTSVHSTVLGLDLRDEREAGMLRLHDPVTGRHLPTPGEEAAARRAADATIEQEVAARQAAEARIAELEARVRDLESALASSRHPQPRKPAR